MRSLAILHDENAHALTPGNLSSRWRVPQKSVSKHAQEARIGMGIAVSFDCQEKVGKKIMGP